MEINQKNELMSRLQDILSDTKLAYHYVYDGKEVRAHGQLEGVKRKLINVINWVNSLDEEPTNVATTHSES